jgi:2-oxoglutarate dehydrogenase E1 component
MPCLCIIFRNEVYRDVFIDLLGYRKYGHNEGDEPQFSQQPLLYKIKQTYIQETLGCKIIVEGVIDIGFVKELEVEYKSDLKTWRRHVKAPDYYYSIYGK